jgi:hypothetical protein
MLCAKEAVVAPSSSANAAINIFNDMVDLRLPLQPASTLLVRPVERPDVPQGQPPEAQSRLPAGLKEDQTTNWHI